MTLSRRGATALLVVLGVSVFLNLVAAGFFGAVFGGATVGGFLLRQRVGPVPVELRHAFRKELFAERRQILRALAQLRHDRSTLHDALTAATLDQPAIDSANAAVRQDVDKLLAIGQDILVKAVVTLPPHVRKQIPQITFGRQLLQSLSTPDAKAGGQ